MMRIEIERVERYQKEEMERREKEINRLGHEKMHL